MVTPDFISKLVDQIARQGMAGAGNALEAAQNERLAVGPWTDRDAALGWAVDHVIALANSRGGDLILGVEADGRVTGVEGLSPPELAKEIFARTRPSLAVDVWAWSGEGKTLLVLHVPQSLHVHSSSDGRRLRREGLENLPITPDQDAEMLAERGAMDISEQALPGVGMEAIDPIQVAYLREILRRRDDQSDLLLLSDPELLSSLGLLTSDGAPRVAALILLGRRAVLAEHLPQVEVVYAHYDAHEEPDHQEHMVWPLLHTLSRLQDCIEARNRFVTLKQGLFHHRVKDFDDEVYREALVNALVHRDYSRRDGAVYVHHYPDRLELANPGGFIGGISRENILYHAPRHRNRCLAEALQQLGLMERGGHGVNRLYRFLLRRGKEAPLYQDTPDSVHLTLQGGGMDEKFAQFVAEEEQSGRVLTLDTLILLSHLKRNRRVDLHSAARLCQRPPRAVSGSLAKMVDVGYVERSQERGGTVAFRLSSRLYKILQKQVSYFRDRGLEARRLQALVVEVAEEMGGLGIDEIQELSATDESGARSLARRLVTTGKLVSRVDDDGVRRYRVPEAVPSGD